MICTKCGAENAPEAKFCIRCGQALVDTASTCPKCRAPVTPGAAFCSQCGQPLGPAGPVNVQVPAAASPIAVRVGPAPADAPTGVGGAPAGAGTPVVMQTASGKHSLLVNIQQVKDTKIDINYNPPEAPEALPLPVEARPEAFPSLLDRHAELQEAFQALDQRAPVEISGEMGLGKTALLRTLGNSPQASVARFPGGVVYRRVYNQPEADLLQAIYSLFYQLPKDYKPSPGEIQRGLQDLRALVILDDVTLSRDELTDLRSQAPQCTFVMAATERLLWGEGRALALGGLPPAEALALLERELGRPLTGQEQPVARQLCTALKGHPDRLLKIAARIQQGQTFTAILQSMGQTPLTPILLAGLPTSELRVLSVVALGKGAPVPLEHIAPLADLPDARPALNTLLQQRLVQAHSPSYTLTGALAQELWRDWDLTPWADRAVGYFIHWAETQADPHRMLPSADVIMQLLEWAVSNQRWTQVIRLGKAIQAALAVGLRWGAWLQVLQWVLMAAQALGERVAEGWALHQIGTHAVCVGDHQAGRTFLTQALQLRHAIGDKAGASVTQHNLNVLLGLLAPPGQGEQPPPEPPASPPAGPAAGMGALKWILPLILVTGLAAAAVAIGLWRPWQDRSPVPTATRTTRPPAPSRTPTRFIQPAPSPTPTGELPPEIVLMFETGCDRVFTPGQRATFIYQPNRDGWVTLRLDGQDLPASAGLEVQANIRYRDVLQVPRVEGQHVLSVFYDLGELAITRECPFNVERAVTPTPPPAVDLWLDPGQCGGQFTPGELLGIHVLASQDGRVDFAVRPAVAAALEWYPIGEVSVLEVAAGQEAKLGWSAPQDFGAWVLRASLNDGQAEALCEFQVVEKNPPVLQEIALVPRLPCEEQMVDMFVYVEDDTGIEAVKLFYRQFESTDYIEFDSIRIDDFTYQFSLYAPLEGGGHFAIEIWDVNGNATTTWENPNSLYSGFTYSGIDYEAYCAAYLVWPRTDLPGMDVPVTPPWTENAFQCMGYCADNLSCQSFTWDASTHFCWLKTGVPQPAPNETCTSAKEFSVLMP